MAAPSNRPLPANEHHINLNTTISLIPFGYKILAEQAFEISLEEKEALWRTSYEFAQWYEGSQKVNLCGLQQAPRHGTILDAYWSYPAPAHPIRMSYTTTMHTSSNDTLCFSGVWKMTEKNIPPTTPTTFTFGVECYEPRRRWLFGMVPTMTEQLGLFVKETSLSISIVGRALFTPHLTQLQIEGVRSWKTEIINSINRLQDNRKLDGYSTSATKL